MRAPRVHSEVRISPVPTRRGPGHPAAGTGPHASSDLRTKIKNRKIHT
jgi:hypothetical protein